MHSQSTISPCPPQLHPPPCHRLSYTTAWHQSHFCHHICDGTEPIQCTTPLAITCYVCSLNIPTHSLYACSYPQYCKYHILCTHYKVPLYRCADCSGLFQHCCMGVPLASPHTVTSLTLCYPWPREPETPSCCPTVPLAMMQPSVQNPQYFHFSM